MQVRELGGAGGGAVMSFGCFSMMVVCEVWGGCWIS